MMARVQWERGMELLLNVHVCSILNILILTAPDNGNVTYSNQLDDGKYIFGTIATYTCSPGYSLRSTENRTCITVDGGGTVGIFSGSESTCGRELAE